MDIVIAAIAVAAFAATVFAVARSVGDARRRPSRTVFDPSGEEWMTIEETATMLEVDADHLMELVAREGIPHFLLAGGHRSNPDHYRFRRDEIDAWTIG